MKASDLRLLLNNIQKGLRLPAGLKGQWSQEANQQLLRALSKPKKIVKKTGSEDGLETKQLAIQDGEAEDKKDEKTQDDRDRHDNIAVGREAEKTQDIEIFRTPRT